MTTIKGGNLPGLKKYLANLLADPNPGVKVGVLDRAVYSEGPAKGESVAQVMSYVEFNKVGGEARAPFRKTIEAKKKQWAKEAEQLLSQSSNSTSLQAALTAVGEIMAFDIAQTIENGLTPPLKDATIERKKHLGADGKLLRDKDGSRSRYKKGKNKGVLKTGPYATDAEKPGILTAQGMKAIKAQYVPDLSKEEGAS